MAKTCNWAEPLGQTLLGMLRALGCRGPDSAGVALFGPPAESWLLQIKLPESYDGNGTLSAVQAAAAGHGPVLDAGVTGGYLRLSVGGRADPTLLERAIEAAVPKIELISLGHSLQILKQVGSPDQLDATYGIAEMDGSHGIGHTRLSTESKVDLSHSQPFWAHGFPDVATVHNGHITNYHKLRRQYEQSGVRFYTENDSEIIGVYLRDQVARGRSFEQALQQSLSDFDGSFSYLAATADALAYVKDRFGFKPLIVADCADFVAVATEELALRQVLPGTYRTSEPPPGTMCVWPVPRFETGKPILRHALDITVS